MPRTESPATLQPFDVLRWERARNSVNGNPRFRFVLRADDGSIIEGTTKPDAGFVYGLRRYPDNIRAAIRVTPTGRVYMIDGATK